MVLRLNGCFDLFELKNKSVQLFKTYRLVCEKVEKDKNIVELRGPSIGRREASPAAGEPRGSRPGLVQSAGLKMRDFVKCVGGEGIVRFP